MKLEACARAPAKLSVDAVLSGRREVIGVHMAENVEDYLIQLVLATRRPEAYGAELKEWIEYGASPRATIALDRCSRAQAWLDERDFVTPDDVRAVLADVLRHRLILSFAAEANGVNADRIIAEMIARVPSA